MAAGAATTMKSMRRRSSSSRSDQPGLDRLAEADVVGDQQVDARKPQRLAQRQQLVGVEPDAGAERRLQQIAVGGGRRAPADGLHIGREDLGTVRRTAADLRPRVVLEHRAPISASHRTSICSPCASSAMQESWTVVRPGWESSSWPRRATVARGPRQNRPASILPKSNPNRANGGNYSERLRMGNTEITREWRLFPGSVWLSSRAERGSASALQSWLLRRTAVLSIPTNLRRHPLFLGGHHAQNLFCYHVSGSNQHTVEVVDIAACDGPCRVAEPGGDGGLRVSEISGRGCGGVAQSVRRHVFKTCAFGVVKGTAVRLHVAPRPRAISNLRRKGAPLGQGSRASLLVDMPRDEMALLIEMIVTWGVN